MKKHPAKKARFMAAWASLSAIVVTSAGVLDNAIVSVDYTSTLNNPVPLQPGTDTLDLTGSAEVAAAPTTVAPEAATTTTTVVDNTKPGNGNQGQPETTQASQPTAAPTTTVAPPTTQEQTTTTRRAKTKPS